MNEQSGEPKEEVMGERMSVTEIEELVPE